MNYHQLGTSLHHEYEAKYSVQNSLVDSKEDAAGFPIKIISVAGTLAAAGILIVLSLLI